MTILTGRQRYWLPTLLILVTTVLYGSIISAPQRGAGQTSGSGCTVMASIISPPDPNPVPEGDNVTTRLTASPIDPTLSSECALTSKSCAWQVTKVEFRDSSNAESVDLTSTMGSNVTVSGDGVEAPAEAVAQGFPVGYWTVTVQVTANWVIDKQSGCADCDCGSCPNAIAQLAFGFTVVGVDRVIVSGSSPEVATSASKWVDEPVKLEAMPKPKDSTFPDNEPTWTLDKAPTGSSITAPEGATKTFTIKPDKPGIYKVTARCGTSTAPFTLTAYKLTITNGDDVDITDQTTTTIVGKKIVVKAKIEPVPVAMPTYRWTVPGKTVKSSTLDKKWPVKVDLADADLKATSVGFYWIAGGANNVTVTVGGKTVSSQFNVTSPTGGFKGFTTTATPAAAVRDGELQFGKPGDPGIRFAGGIKAPSGFSGDCACLQLISTKGFNVTDDGTKVGLSSDGKYVLDDKDDDEPFYDGAFAVNDTKIAPYISNDRPGVPIESTWTNMSVTDSFKMYCMFKPTGGDSIWVTIFILNWNWAADATLSNGNWTVANPAFTKDPVGVSSSELPTWSGLFTEINVGEIE